VPGLGASFGRGAATSFQQDLANSDCILIMGSNMAEAHPVGFRWPMKAREKGATLIHVDPRFSRTSACVDRYVQIRAGADIAFLGGIIHQILKNESWFKEYVLAYTNASTIIAEGFEDTEDLEGIFSGYQKDGREYEAGKGHWAYEGSTASKKPVEGASAPPSQGPGGPGTGGGERVQENSGHGIHGPGLMGGASHHGSQRSGTTDAPHGDPPRDETLQHPRCVMQLLKKHYARYTPETVAEICGCTPGQVEEVARLLAENSGREKTSSIVYAVGWTQHTTGVQIIRAAGIIQLLLGNMGRPGGGIMAMRGHCSIQGSTDIPTLYDLLPGYLTQPSAEKTHETLDGYVKYEGLETGYWANYKKFVVSLLKAWYGEAATKANDFHFDWLPRLDGDYSQLPFFKMMNEGKVEGYFVFGQNPAAGGPNAGLHRAGLRKLKWLVVADWFETETATFWKNDPKGPPAESIETEVFMIPAAGIAEKEGSFTNTQRLIQWHDKAIDPPADCRSDLWFVYNLGKRLKRLYANSTEAKDEAIQALTWDYDYDEEPRLPDGSVSRIEGEPDANKVMKEINGYDLTKKDERTGKQKLLSGFSECKEDGTTSCGCWIYSGIFPEHDRNRARERETSADNYTHPNWAYAWPHNRRIMYNRASADPEGKPWSERKKYIWWDEGQQKWTGVDEPDFEPKKAPSYLPKEGAKGMEAIGGADPFIMKPDGMGWIFSPAVKDGPFPTHYEPAESPFTNKLYPKQMDSPVTRYFEGPDNVISHCPSPDYPVIACTFRLTEHYLSGPMSRFNSWLNELQPEMFAELSPELAAERAITHGDWMVIRSPRGEIEARAMVTRRMRPLEVQGQVVHQIGLPFHWGFAGEAVGDQANDLTSLVADPNVSMHEGKVFVCDVRAGRLPEHLRVKPTKKIAARPDNVRAPETAPEAQPEGRKQ
jgi:formate dehydrogenase major subunit